MAASFFTPIPCTYTSSPPDGTARNYYFYLHWYARSRNLSCLDPFCSFLLICEDKKNIWSELELNPIEPRSLCFTSDRSNHQTMAPQAADSSSNSTGLRTLLAQKTNADLGFEKGAKFSHGLFWYSKYGHSRPCFLKCHFTFIKTASRQVKYEANVGRFESQLYTCRPNKNGTKRLQQEQPKQPTTQVHS